MISVRAVFFDFDGVILESAGLKHAVFVEVATEHSPELGKALQEALTGELGSSERVRVAHWMKMRDPRLDEGRFLRDFTSRVKSRLEAASLVAGVAPFIQDCRERGLILAIISAAPENEIRRLLSLKGIDPESFAAIGGSQSGSKETVARQVCERLSLEPSSVLYFGDMPSDLNLCEAIGFHFGRVLSSAGERCQWANGAFPVFADFVDCKAIETGHK
ncbi:MAG: HAD family hydrolase [Deltaproteobacteria bacterium]|nr:HAD family hydrolase [Deltaproteobacteria bacterium]MBI3294149.1 HAD family hydrolase [Deltaproteobacteria bacterium]